MALFLGATTVGFGSAAAWLWFQRDAPLGVDRSAYLQRTQELVSGSGGIWDSHPDPDVGRVLMPDLDGRLDHGVAVRSNRYGLRETSYELPKPADVVRVALLGDSMIFGFGVEQEQRVGARLAELLAPSARRAGRRVECLHVGLTAWNARAECCYLRRQLSLMRPDVVLHFVLRNDLDDNPSVRGFGALADFTDQWRTHADGTLADTHARLLGAGSKAVSPLVAALDFEGKQRLSAAAEEIVRLRDAVTARGGRYFLVFIDPQQVPAAVTGIRSVLKSEEVTLLPPLERKFRLAEGDEHWNTAGMRTVGEYCYGLLRARQAVANLVLEESGDADQCFARLSGEAERQVQESRMQRDVEALIGNEIVFDGGADRDRGSLRQVHGGIAAPDIVLAYASMILRNEDARAVQIEGERFDRVELRGGKCNVFVDELNVGRFELGGGGPEGRDLSLTFPLSAVLRGRAFVSVRFVSDDWVLDGADLRRCICFRLRRVRMLL